MIEITSPSNPSYRKALRLHESRGRKQQQRIIIFGQNEIGRALAADVKVEQVFIAASRKLAETAALVDKFESIGAQVIELPDDMFGRLCFGQRIEEVVVIANRPATELHQLKMVASSLIVVLEGIEKPGNVGAVFRSAVAAGVDAIILANPLTDVFHPNAIRSSVGSVFTVPVFVGASEQVKQLLIDASVQIAVARVDSSESYTEVDLTCATALVVGNEHSGLTDIWSGDGTTPVKIPMNSEIDSLNVAMSATILAYEARRQREC